MPDTPTRMPREEYTVRVRRLVDSVLALEGGKPAADLRAEAEALFGYQADRVLGALDAPPAICSRCGCLHQGYGPRCYGCVGKGEQEERESAIRADERAKVLAEQKAAREAEVSAELALTGEF